MAFNVLSYRRDSRERVVLVEANEAGNWLVIVILLHGILRIS